MGRNVQGCSYSPSARQGPILTLSPLRPFPSLHPVSIPPKDPVCLGPRSHSAGASFPYPSPPPRQDPRLPGASEALSLPSRLAAMAAADWQLHLLGGGCVWGGMIAWGAGGMKRLPWLKQQQLGGRFGWGRAAPGCGRGRLQGKQGDGCMGSRGLRAR